MDLKSIWKDNPLEKFQAIWLDLDNFVPQESSKCTMETLGINIRKFCQDKVQAVGITVRKLYDEIIQEFLYSEFVEFILEQNPDKSLNQDIAVELAKCQEEVYEESQDSLSNEYEREKYKNAELIPLSAINNNPEEEEGNFTGSLSTLGDGSIIPGERLEKKDADSGLVLPDYFSPTSGSGLWVSNEDDMISTAGLWILNEEEDMIASAGTTSSYLRNIVRNNVMVVPSVDLKTERFEMNIGSFLNVEKMDTSHLPLEKKKSFKKRLQEMFISERTRKAHNDQIDTEIKELTEISTEDLKFDSKGSPSSHEADEDWVLL